MRTMKMSIRRVLSRVGWALLGMVLLTGCEMLKGFGEGLGNVFKNFKFP